TALTTVRVSASAAASSPCVANPSRMRHVCSLEPSKAPLAETGVLVVGMRNSPDGGRVRRLERAPRPRLRIRREQVNPVKKKHRRVRLKSDGIRSGLTRAGSLSYVHGMRLNGR